MGLDQAAFGDASGNQPMTGFDKGSKSIFTNTSVSDFEIWFVQTLVPM